MSVDCTPCSLQRFSYQTSLSLIAILVGTSARQVSHSEVVCPQNTYGRALRNSSVIGGPRVRGGNDHPSRIGEDCGREEMKQRERPDQWAIRLDEFPDEALCAIKANHEIEPVLDHERVSAQSRQHIDQGEYRHHGAFVELHRVAQHAVTEVGPPW